MGKLPLVSIITPSYNQGEFIEDAILSVKNQRYQNIEHIIVDGASSDNTLAIIKKYEGTYNLRWVSEPDNGPVEADNKGIAEAQGEILVLFDADCLYFPWTVSVVAEYFKQHPEVELIYGDIIYMDLATGMNWLAFCPQFSLPFLRRSGTLPTPAAFFCESVVEKVGLLDENLRWGADYEYWIRVSEQCEVLKIEEFLAVDRLHPERRRVRLRQQIHRETKRVRQRYGGTKGMMKYPFKIADMSRRFAATRFSKIKFVFYYWTKARRSSHVSLPYPYRNLLEFSGFQVVSWAKFLITLLPRGYWKYKGNWFMLEVAWKSRGKD